MGKKCIPGVICVENLTLFVLIIITLLLAYIYSNNINKPSTPTTIRILTTPSINPLVNTNISTRNADLGDPYIPPLQNDIQTPNSFLNVFNSSYQQKGILTKPGGMGGDNLILPLMGRKVQRNRDKWQYYTMSNSGFFNTRLPISSKGKSCMVEYGCDELMNGDTVYVEGYNDMFTITIYENGSFSYNPFM